MEENCLGRAPLSRLWCKCLRHVSGVNPPTPCPASSENQVAEQVQQVPTVP